MAKPNERGTTRTGAKAVVTPSPAPAARPVAGGKLKVSAEDRYRMLCDAAYFIAEKDGFQAGKELDYWLQAEASVGAKLA